MDFAVFTSLIAIAIALGALWAAGSALGKIEDQNQILLQSQINPLRAEMNKITLHLNKIQKQFGQAGNAEEEIQGQFSRQGEKIVEIEEKMVEIRRDLDALDKSVPGRNRTLRSNSSRGDPSFQ